ncbi:hypothetical protein QJQ45_019833, partial [Haematococcus lacustris]
WRSSGGAFTCYFLWRERKDELCLGQCRRNPTTKFRIATRHYSQSLTMRSAIERLPERPAQPAIGTTHHGRKCKLAHLIDHLPQALWAAFLVVVLARVEACSELAVLGSLLLGFLGRDLCTLHMADLHGPLDLHGQPDIQVSQAAIPDLSCRNLFLQLCRGLPGDGEYTRPIAAVAAVLAAHPDIRVRLEAIPRYRSDTNMVDHVKHTVGDSVQQHAHAALRWQAQEVSVPGPGKASDLQWLEEAVIVSGSSAGGQPAQLVESLRGAPVSFQHVLSPAYSPGLTAPHPNAGCVLVDSQGRRLAATCQRASGSVSAEVLAVETARGAAQGATAYLNLESGDCHGDDAAVSALITAGVQRVVLGLRHPLPHMRGAAVQAFYSHGLAVVRHSWSTLAAQALGLLAVIPRGLCAHQLLPSLATFLLASLALGQQPCPMVYSVPRHAVLLPTPAAVPTDVLGLSECTADEAHEASVLQGVLAANEGLLHRAARRRPLSILKYAMTLDGKIATEQGHSAWVTSPPARALVFEARARSDAVIVGGNTVRRDNPRLTTRRDSGHAPIRIVMSRTLDLPEDAALWDTSMAPTIVATQKGARTNFQSKLRARGVEVIEFDFLSPDVVADYCYNRGFLQCFWECGGTLAAPCISTATVHKFMSFIAPKVIGGAQAPTPVGDLGFVEMTQAVELVGVRWGQVGPDLMLTGYLPASGGPGQLAAELEAAAGEPGTRGLAAVAALGAAGPCLDSRPGSSRAAAGQGGEQAAASASRGGLPQQQAALGSLGGTASALQGVGTPPSTWVTTTTPTSSHGEGSGEGGELGNSSGEVGSSSSSSGGVKQGGVGAHGRVVLRGGRGVRSGPALPFYKAWDMWGALTNFSPHPISLPHFHAGEQAVSEQAAVMAGNTFGSTFSIPPPHASSLAARSREARQWSSVEHYYQAQKFAGSGAAGAGELVAAIAAAESPEEAARIGRRAERMQPELVTPGWHSIKVEVMLGALRAKFTTHASPRQLLLSTCQPLADSQQPSARGAGPQPCSAQPPGSGSQARGLACAPLQNRLVEASPHDYFWGAGHTGQGRNVLGQLLELVRHELLPSC